ncbi:hypothetical protein IT397_00570 [Candidatus Nomurabacteria bacterium]|nr:hypothetical protein [Candidatus Nomurabacteria bacterium]
MRLIFKFCALAVVAPVLWLVWGVLVGDIPEVDSIRFMKWNIQDLPFTLSRLQTDCLILPMLYFIHLLSIGRLAESRAEFLGRDSEDMKSTATEGSLYMGVLYSIIIACLFVLGKIPYLGGIFTVVALFSICFIAWESVNEGPFCECLQAAGFRVFLPVSIVSGFLTGATFFLVALVMLFFRLLTNRVYEEKSLY